MIKHLLISFLALSITATAQAGIISGNIDDSKSLPASLLLNTLPESDTHISLYKEQENFLLLENLNVDYIGSSKDEGVIAAGTMVNSFFLNFDAEGIEYTQDSLHGFGSYLFDTEILGIIWSGTRPGAQPVSKGFLDLSDDILGLATTAYPTGVLGTAYPTDVLGRGLEPEAFYNTNNTEDVVTVSNFGRQLDLSLFVKPAYADQLRVITAVPEPSTLVLFGAAALCLLNLRRVS